MVMFLFTSRRRETRYIGDWSTGVCSSDLECVVSEEAWKARERRREKVERVSSVRAPMIGRIGLAELAEGRFKIGRASCRERVWISVRALARKGKARGRCRAE